MYKDKLKQKEAVRKAVAKHRGVIPADVIPETRLVWEAGGYRGEWIDGVFCVNGKPYRIGDILDLQHASYQMIANLYAM